MRLKHIVFDPDRHGNPRWYYRRCTASGLWRKLRIRADHTDVDAFLRAYLAIHNRWSTLVFSPAKSGGDDDLQLLNKVAVTRALKLTRKTIKHVNIPWILIGKRHYVTRGELRNWIARQPRQRGLHAERELRP